MKNLEEKESCRQSAAIPGHRSAYVTERLSFLGRGGIIRLTLKNRAAKTRRAQSAASLVAYIVK
jgi:hypothetical protein